MAIKLTDLRKRVQNSFVSVRILRENLSSTITIVERDNGATLNSIKILSAPIDNVWIFDNEDGEKIFLSSGKKVEQTVIYFNEEQRRLYIFMIELKSTLDERKLIHCRDKFQDTLSHVSIYLLLNHHNESFEGVDIVPIGLIFYNQEIISTQSIQNLNESVLINNFKNYIQNNDDNFLVILETIALGRQMIPISCFENQHSGNEIEVEFAKILEKI